MGALNIHNLAHATPQTEESEQRTGALKKMKPAPIICAVRKYHGKSLPHTCPMVVEHIVDQRVRPSVV
jgi:hypothetical protein